MSNNIDKKENKKIIELCSIYNIKNGLCGEDCKFCAQGRLAKNRLAPVPITYNEKAIQTAISNGEKGVSRFSFVASGRATSNAETDVICDMCFAIQEKSDISLCASLGLLDYERLKKLKEAGVSRYHCNLETSREYFPKICSTHSYDDKLRTIEAAKKAGLSICSGVLIGRGESMKDRIEVAKDLARLEVDSVPLNILIPIAGSPLENLSPLSYEEIIESVYEMNNVLPSNILRLAGGRMNLPDLGLELMKDCVGSIITGDMLTPAGNQILKDKEMIERAGMEVGRR